MFWIARHTIGPRQLKKILDAKAFPSGGPTMPATVFPPEKCSDEEAVRQLGATVDRVNHHAGPLHASPLFGKLDRQTHIQLQLIHAAHHLGHLVPKR
jgi:hypothetical protein